MSNEVSTFDKIMLFSRKFLLPIFFVAIGAIFVYFAFSTREGEYNKKVEGKIEVTKLENTSALGADREEGPNQAMIIGALACLVAAIVSLAFVTGKIKKSVGSIVAILFIPAIGYMCFRIWKSIDDHRGLSEQRELYKDEIRNRLVDIRTAQEAYKKENGDFVKDLNALIEFVKNGTTSTVVKFGSPLKRRITSAENEYLYPGENRPIDKFMSEMEAFRLSQSPICSDSLRDFRRDTIKEPVKDKLFLTEAKIESRKKHSIYPEFNPDSLKFIPFTGGKEFVVNFDTIRNPMKAAVFQIEVLHPFLERFDDTLRIGSLEKIDLSGNWEQ